MDAPLTLEINESIYLSITSIWQDMACRLKRSVPALWIRLNITAIHCTWDSGEHSPSVDARSVSSTPRELSEGAFHSHSAQHTLGIYRRKAKRKAFGLLVPKKSLYTDTAESIGLLGEKTNETLGSYPRTSSSHVYYGHSDRAPDVACSFYVAAHSSSSSSSSPPLSHAQPNT